MGTEKESFIQLSERIDRTTGGLSISPSISHKKGQAEPVRHPHHLPHAVETLQGCTCGYMRCTGAACHTVSR
jgi:hypothetical protein